MESGDFNRGPTKPLDVEGFVDLGGGNAGATAQPGATGIESALDSGVGALPVLAATAIIAARGMIRPLRRTSG